MKDLLTRRNWLRIGVGALGYPFAIAAQQPPAPAGAPAGRGGGPPAPDPFVVPVKPFTPVSYRSTVSLLKGENRRKMVHDSIMAIDEQVKAKMKGKKYAIIKVNLTNTTNQLAATHPDAIAGIMDYLVQRFKGPVIIAEAASGDTVAGFDNFKYAQVVNEFKRQKVSLLDFNRDGQYVVVPTIDSNVHPTACRIAARLTDPEAFVICAAIPKTHDAQIMTGVVKNMAMGSPLHSAPGVTPTWSDKRKLHVTGYQQHTLNMMLVSQRIAPSWGLGVLDGYETMEGSGPVRGDMVPHRIFLASTDFVAADRVATECMGIDANWVGHLQYCAAVGLGNFDLGKIDVKGETVASVQRTYKLHPLVERQKTWKDPLTPAAPAAPARPGGTAPAGAPNAGGRG